MKYDLQMFAEAVKGNKVIYLYRILEEESTTDAAAIMFVTEDSITMSKDADSTATKDGAIRTPGELEIEKTGTSILAKGDKMFDKLAEAMKKDKLIEIWEVNLEEPAQTGNNKFKGTYYQGYLTEFEKTANAEDYVEISTTFGINGTGAAGDVTVTTEQQEVAAYVFKDTERTGA